MENSLLSYITSNFTTDYENIANSSIAYMLNNYEEFRKILKEMLNQKNKFLNNELPLYYTREYDLKNNGRPDIIGKDKNGKISIIIEGKFWAKLTKNQPNNYLKEIDKNGLLIFLCPENRKKSLLYDLEKRLKNEYDKIEDKFNKIVIFSWLELINRTKENINLKTNKSLESDLYQLEKMINIMEEEGIQPFTSSDLDPMNGKLFYNFSLLIDECKNKLKNNNNFDFKKLQSTSTYDGYGFYFKSKNIGYNLNFSSYYWFKKEKTSTPIWLDIYDIENGKWLKGDKYFYKLKESGEEHIYNDNKYVSCGIILKPGSNKDDMVKIITKRVEEINNFLTKKSGQIKNY